MEWGMKLGLYIGVSVTIATVALIAIFIGVRYLWQQRQKPKKTIANGILGQIGISHHAPEFMIPLMVPLLLQDSLSSNEDPDACQAGLRARSSTWQGTPSFVQPQGDQEYGDQLTPETADAGPWKSGIRRESLFFPGASGDVVRWSRTSSTGTGSDVTSPRSPSPGAERKIPSQRVRAISDVSSTSCDNISAIVRAGAKCSTSSDTETGRKISQTSRPEHRNLRKMVSVPADSGATKPRPQLKKRFSEIHRRQSSDSLSIVGSAKPAKPLPSTKRGRIVLSLRYNEEERQFIVHLINATDLPMKNNNLLDSYARLYLGTPAKQHRQQSKVHKKTCNPIYDETFVFEDIDPSELRQSTLRLKIMNKDSGFTRGDVIGEAVVFLSDDNVLVDKTITKELLPKSSGITVEDGPGELSVSVCHQATSAQLKVVILKMKDLPKFCKNPTISIELTHKGETVQKQQTRPKKTKKSQDYHEEFNFHIPTSSSCTLESYSLQFSVYSQDILRGLVCVGYVTLGEDAPFQSEVDHWRSVVSCPHKPITEWHKFHRTPY